MKKRNLIGALLCSVCLITGSAMPVMADSVKVVTLGADLSQEQKDTMMRYFKVNSNEVQILTITNQDERDHLSSYVPLEQIGTRTVSCAYVKPTQSGGIKVRTANLNWVTGNMIATTLSTSGVKNCEVVAACPFEVSGTGALTGIQMAYESASGEKLDETKKQLATEEFVVTGNLAEQVGQNDATTVINQAKMQIIQNNIQDADEIYNIVINIAQQNNVTVDTEQLDKIVSLLEEIAQQNYNYDDVKDTLEHVDENVSGETTDEGETGLEGEGDEDSIVSGLDESILGSDVIASSTEDPSLEQETGGQTDMPATEPEGEEPQTELGEEGIPEAEPSEVGELQPAETEGTLNTDSLTEEDKALFDKAKTFCAGEFQGDEASLKTAAGEDAVVSVVLDEETGKKLADKVLSDYLEILTAGTDAYVPGDLDIYMTPELNMLNKEMTKLFTIEGAVPDGTDGDILVNVSQEDKDTLYSDTMSFFEKLYGEVTESYGEEGAADTGSEDVPQE
ncbi:MAG: DUF1002 domain-containing protein [Eubacteriales bacterium]|nr:DUF1002 domain-containing protein [Eubacteriales bacterium]